MELGHGVVTADYVESGVRIGPELVLYGITGVGLFFCVSLVAGEEDVEDIAVIVFGEVEATELGDGATDFSEELVVVLVRGGVQVLAGVLGASVARSCDEQGKHSYGCKELRGEHWGYLR